MKLYYSPGTCSLAVHIALREIDAEFDLEKVDLAAKRTEAGDDFNAINPNGYVPTLRLDDGEILFEAPAVLQYIADSRPERALAPAAGSLDRVRLQQYLNYTASELHKSFSPFFAATKPEGVWREAALAKLHRRFDYLDRLLADGREYLMGDTFTVADAYTFVVASWADPVGIGLENWPHVKAYVERVSRRPQVRAAMQREGLIH
ncbi:MAG: glutathione transferase GstA [Azospirillaceae bacterium]